MASDANQDLQQAVQTITLTGEDGTTQVYTMDDASQIVAGLSGVGAGSGQEVLVENDGNIFYLIQSETDSLQGVSYVVIDEHGNPTEQAETVDLAALTSEEAVTNFNGAVQVEMAQADTANELENSAGDADMVMIEMSNAENLHKDLTSLVNYSSVAEPNKAFEQEVVTQKRIKIEKDYEQENVKYVLCCHCCGEALETVDELKSHLLEFHGISDGLDDPKEEVRVDSVVVSDKRSDAQYGGVKELSIIELTNNETGRKNVHKCQFCVKSFEVRSDLDLHIEVDHEYLDDLFDFQSDDNWYCKCPHCPRLYLSRWASKSLRRHIRVDHPDCIDDPAAYEMVEVQDKSQLRKLKSDINTFHDEQQYSCPLCPKVFYWQKSLIRHTKLFHADQIKQLSADQYKSIFGNGRKRKNFESASQDGLVEVHSCPYCSKNFLWQKSLKKHVASDHPEHCREFLEIDAQKTIKTGKRKSLEQEGLTHYKCPYCNLVSKYNHSVRKHIERTHSEHTKGIDVKDLEIPMVDNRSGKYTVKTADTKAKVMRLSDSPVVFSCPKCKYITDNKSNLQRHLTSRVHNHAYKMADLQGNMSLFLKEQNVNASTPAKVTTGTQVDKSTDSTIPDVNTAEESSEPDNNVRDTEVTIRVTFDTEDASEPDDIDSGAVDKTTDSKHADDTGQTQTEEIKRLDCKLADIPELCKIHINLRITFNCTKCSESFFRFEKLQEHHQQNHGTEEEFEATPDDRIAADLVQKDIPKLKALECPYCDMIVSQAPVLEQHISLNHQSCVNQLTIKQEPGETVDIPTASITADGSDTSSKYKSDGTVADPGIRNSVVTAYRCIVCVCEFPEVLDLIKHMSIVHPDSEKIVKQAPKKRGRKRKTLEMSTTSTPVVTRSPAVGDDYDNKCPHCEFSCKRASALTFHINFNHAHIKQEPQDEDETPRKRAKQNHAIEKVNELNDDVEQGAAEVHADVEITKPTARKRGRPRKSLLDTKKILENDGIDNSLKQADIETSIYSSATDEVNNTDDKVDKADADLPVTEEGSKEKGESQTEYQEVIKKDVIINVTPVSAKTRVRKKKKRGRRKSNILKVRDNVGEEDDSEEEDCFDENVGFGFDDDLDTDYQPAEEEISVKPEAQIMRHKCPYCESGFLSLRFLEKHVKRSHPDEFKSFCLDDVKLTESESALSVVTHRCTYCKKSFPSQKSVHDHMTKWHKIIKQESEKLNEKQLIVQELTGQNNNEDDTEMSTIPVHVPGISVVRAMSDQNKNKENKKSETVIEALSTLLVQKGGTVNVQNVSNPVSNEINYKCRYCNVFFTSKDSVIRHAALVHTKEPKLDPDEIDCIYNNTDANLQNTYLCPYCDFVSTWKKCIVRHVKNVHPDVKDFDADDIQVQIGVHSDTPKLPEIGNYKCPFCNAVYKWKKSVILHIRKMHPNQTCDFDLLSVCMKLDEASANKSGADNLDARKKRRVVHCTKCDFTSGMIKKVERHYQSCHPEDWDTTTEKFSYTYVSSVDDGSLAECHTCALCGTTYTWKKSLLLHVKRHHNDMLDVYETLNGMVEVLDRSLAVKEDSKPSLQRHNCTLCGATFKTLMAKMIHLRMKHRTGYTKGKPSSRPVCGVCKLSFSSRLALAKHRAVNHLRHKPHECAMCSKMCSGRRSLLLHEQICQGTRKLVCPENNCNFECILQFSMKNHQKLCSLQQFNPSCRTAPPLSEKCELCGHRYPGAVGLKTHVMQAHFSRTWFLTGITRRKRQFTCSTCNKTFRKPSLRDRHIALKHKDETNMCEVCGDVFSTLMQLQRHYLKHTGMIEREVCHLCNTAVLKNNLHKHYLYKHPASCVCECKICTSQETDSVRGIACDICGQKFCRKMILNAHKIVKHDYDKKNKYKCKYCNRLFRTNKARFMHIHKSHGKSRQVAASTTLDVTQNIATAGEGEEKENASTHVIHIGESQGVQYLPRLSESSLSAVIKELMIVSSDKLSKLPYKCLLCGRSFAKTKYIRLHIRRNHVKDEDQPYRCKICGSGFVRLTEFRKHSRAHSGFRPYKCKICGRAFKQQANLSDHLNLHTGSRAYECYICNRQFRQRGALNAHINHHDMLKPFKCVFCDKGFTTRGELSRHMQKYDLEEEKGNDDRSFMCHVCSCTFTHFPLLQKHIDELHPEKPFHCQACDAKFAAFTSLYNHKLRSEHFLHSELEGSGGSMVRKIRRNRKSLNDTQEAVYTLQEGVDSDSIHNRLDVDPMSKQRHDVALTLDQHPTSTVCFIGDQNEVAETVYITHDGEILEAQGEDGKRLEVVIEQFPTEEIVSGTQINSENEELLSIAKQLTELSTYTEAEACDTENTTMLQEEDEIMKDMLDADEELLDSIGKHLGGRRDDGTDNWPARTLTVEVVPQTSITDTTQIEMTQSVDTREQEVENAVAEVTEKQAVVEASPSKTIPTNMEELATLIAQNSQMSLEGESVTAYQTEDGSIIYVCMDQANTMEGETYDITTTEDYTEVQTGETTVDATDQYNNGDVENGNVVVMEEQAQTIQEAGIIVQEDGTVIQAVGTIEGDDGAVIQDNETVIHETETVIHDGQTVNNNDGRTIIHTDSTGRQFDVGPMSLDIGPTSNQRHMIAVDGSGNVIQESSTIITGEDEDTADNVECVAAAAASDSLIRHDKMDTKTDQTDIVQAELTAMTQADETTISNELYLASGQKVIEYLHDEQTFIKEELMSKDYGKAVEDMTNVIADSRVLKYEMQDNEFRCLKCNYKCLNHKNMKKHLKRHTPFGYRQYDCTFCGKKFITSGELVRHLHIHTGEKNYACKYCGKKFRQVGHLKDHIKTHLGQKDYKCCDCEATFTTKSQCDTHWQRRHSNEREYCNECGKSFSDKQGLIKHKGAIHSTLSLIQSTSKRKNLSQPFEFSCRICGASYSKKTSLQSHVLTTHKKTNKTPATFMCEVCGDSLKSKTLLKEHIIINHSDEKPEVCEYCGCTFKLKKQLTFHIRLKHKPVDQKSKQTFYCGCGKKFSTKNSFSYHLGKSDACRVGKVTVTEDKEAVANIVVSNDMGEATVE